MPATPTPISGFPEWLPAVRMLEQRVLGIRDAYELFGFAPLETPAVERLDALTAKSGMQRQIYSLGRPDEDGEDARTSLGLHFDLTVPPLLISRPRLGSRPLTAPSTAGAAGYRSALRSTSTVSSMRKRSTSLM